MQLQISNIIKKNILTHKTTVLKSRMVGATYYAAVKKTIFATESEPETSKVFAAIFLTSVSINDYHNFSYKDMDESMGPFQYNCPRSILDLLSPTDNEYALNWREACYKNVRKNHDPNSLSNMPIGTVIKVRMPFDTKYYKEGDEVKLTKGTMFGSNRTAWYAPRARFTRNLMKQLEENGAIIK